MSDESAGTPSPGYEEALVYGDASADSLGVTKITVDRILKMERPDHCLALYVFFCYTARWQKTAQAKCTVSYASTAMGWSERVTQRAKAQLVKAGLVDNVKHVDSETGQVKGWYIRVRYLARLHPAIGGTVVHPAKIPVGGNLAPKCFETIKVNASETNSVVVEERAKKPRKGSGKATIEEVTAFTASIGLPATDGEYMFHNFEEKGWGKNWQAAIRKWNVAKWLPSQKPQKSFSNAKEKVPEFDSEGNYIGWKNYH